MSGSAVVFGSVHMDVIARAAALPDRGESISGGTFSMAPGGKGGNQAVQLALNGVATSIVTRVGADVFGRALLDALRSKGVETDRVIVDPDHPTGASVVLADAGDYASIIAPGAAAELRREDLEAARDRIAAADAALIQWEVPTAIVAETVAFCADLGVTVVFNASPVTERAAALPGTFWAPIDWLVVNRFEADRLLGFDSGRTLTVAEIASRLRDELGIANVLITLGAEGSYWLGPSGFAFQPALPAQVVDTVGAGDAFLGTFVATLIQRQTIPLALRRAAAAGALTVGRSGAYDAMPASVEIDDFLASRDR